MATLTIEAPAAVVARARAKARESETTLEAHLGRVVASVAENGVLGAAGGRARAEALSARRRSEISRQGAEAMHRQRRRRARERS